MTKTKFKIQKQPNPQTHLIISLIKSGIRIAAGLALVIAGFSWAGYLLVGAEVLGILEELF